MRKLETEGSRASALRFRTRIFPRENVGNLETTKLLEPLGGRAQPGDAPGGLPGPAWGLPGPSWRPPGASRGAQICSFHVFYMRFSKQATSIIGCVALCAPTKSCSRSGKTTPLRSNNNIGFVALCVSGPGPAQHSRQQPAARSQQPRAQLSQPTSRRSNNPARRNARSV